MIISSTDDDIPLLAARIRYDPLTGDLFWRTGLRAGRKVALHIRGKGYLGFRISLRPKERERNFRAHRVAFALMTGRWPQDQTDHKNRNKTDNRWDNLREANNSQNNVNRALQRNNTSGFCGVDLVDNNRWRARLKVDGKRYTLGQFATREEAASVHDGWSEIFFGEFAAPQLLKESA